jgi:hypothetical protein
LGQLLRDHAFDLFGRPRLIAIAKDPSKPAWDDAVVASRADERSWHDVFLQRAV